MSDFETLSATDHLRHRVHRLAGLWHRAAVAAEVRRLFWTGQTAWPANGLVFGDAVSVRAVVGTVLGSDWPPAGVARGVGRLDGVLWSVRLGHVAGQRRSTAGPVGDPVAVHHAHRSGHRRCDDSDG